MMAFPNLSFLAQTKSCDPCLTFGNAFAFLLLTPTWNRLRLRRIHLLRSFSKAGEIGIIEMEGSLELRERDDSQAVPGLSGRTRTPQEHRNKMFTPCESAKSYISTWTHSTRR